MALIGYARVSTTQQDLAQPLEALKERGVKEDNLRPGLLLRFQQGRQLTDARPARLAALHVPRGQPATPFLKAEPFRAEFDGFLRLDLGGEYSFTVKGTGLADLSINGKVVLQASGNLQRITR